MSYVLKEIIIGYQGALCDAACPSSKYGVKCAERCRCKNGELNNCMHFSIFGFFELNVSYIRYNKYQCYGICLPFKCDAFSLIRVILIMYVLSISMDMVDVYNKWLFAAWHHIIFLVSGIGTIHWPICDDKNTFEY